MKKALNQIVMVLGFVVTVIGTALSNLSFASAGIATFATVNLAAIFAVTCIFAGNKVIKNIGYALACFVAAYGVGILAWYDPDAGDIGALVASIGMLIMGVAVLLYALLFVLKAFGFLNYGIIGLD